MNDHDTQILKIQDDISKKLSPGLEIEIHIPGWSPVGLEEGFQWIRATIYEGYYLKYQIISKNGVNVVSLLKWEFGEDEPDFPG